MRRFALGFFLGVLTPGLVFLFAVVIGAFKIEADAPRLRIEGRLAKQAFNASIRRIPAEQNPYRVDDAFLLEGLKLFQSGCAGCHGEYSKPSDWGSRHFYPPAPQFGEAPPRRTEAEIFYIVQHGIRYSGMGGWSGLMNKEQTWRVASFLSRLDDLPPQVAAEWRKP